jgi:hypothetical protein
MTSETMNLHELLEKTTDADFLREMIGYTAQRLMDVEVEALTAAAPGVRDPGRLNQRNGCHVRFQGLRTHKSTRFFFFPVGFSDAGMHGGGRALSDG